MLPDKAKNFAKVTLSAGITSTATALSVAAGTGSRLPAVPFNAVVWNATDYPDPSDDPDVEVIRVTAQSTDTCTITRAQENTTARDHNTAGKTYKLLAGLLASTINQYLEGEYHNAKGFGLVGNGVTDDTVALQTLINQLVAGGGGRIFFPPGVYLIGGALQDTAGVNAQITLPQIPVTSPAVTIELLGAQAPPTQFYVGSPVTLPGCSVIKSTLTGATGNASFMAGRESGGYPTNLWDNVHLIVRNLIFQAPPNPSFTMFNCFNLMGPHFEQCLFHTGSFDINTITEPTNSNAYAIKLAPSNHSTGQRINVVNVYGFYNGILDGELAEIHANCIGCKRSFVIPFNWHPSSHRILGSFNSQNAISPAGPGFTPISGDDGTKYLRIQLLSIEQNSSELGLGPSWANTIYDINDPDDLLIGDVQWVVNKAGVGNTHNFIKNGGARFNTQEVGYVYTPPVDMSDLLIGLVAYWKLNETSGTRNDSYGTNHLTDINTVGQVSGKLLNAANFIGANSETLSRASDTAMQTGDISFTLCAWVRIASIAVDGVAATILGKLVTSPASSCEYGLDLLTGAGADYLRFYCFTAAGPFSVSSAGPAAVGTWYFLVAWHDADLNTVNLQVNDGTVISTSTTGSPVNSSSTEFRIGSYGSNAHYFNGAIDEVGFWKRVLTPAERTALFNGGVGLTYPFE